MKRLIYLQGSHRSTDLRKLNIKGNRTRWGWKTVRECSEWKGGTLLALAREDGPM